MGWITVVKRTAEGSKIKASALVTASYTPQTRTRATLTIGVRPGAEVAFWADGAMVDVEFGDGDDAGSLRVRPGRGFKLANGGGRSGSCLPLLRLPPPVWLAVADRAWKTQMTFTVGANFLVATLPDQFALKIATLPDPYRTPEGKKSGRVSREMPEPAKPVAFEMFPGAKRASGFSMTGDVADPAIARTLAQVGKPTGRV